MTYAGQNFEMYLGDTKQVIITVYDENDAILDLSGYDITWVLYKLTSKQIVLTKTLGSGISVPAPSSGQIVIDILPVDTENLVPNTYVHECELSSSPTDVSTITTGTVKLIYSRA